VRPYANQITAPVLRALVRAQVAELAGLPADQLQMLLGSAPAEESSAMRPPRAAVPPRGPARRPPSLLRAMLQGVLLEPSLARRHMLPRSEERGPEPSAWNALLDYCAAAQADPTTAGVVQHFADSEHAGAMGEILAAAVDQALSSDQIETQVLAAAARWQHADDQRALQSLLRQPLEALTADEREALTRGLIATARGVRRDGDAPS
jgi:hypothetical protein